MPSLSAFKWRNCLQRVCQPSSGRRRLSICSHYFVTTLEHLVLARSTDVHLALPWWWKRRWWSHGGLSVSAEPRTRDGEAGLSMSAHPPPCRNTWTVGVARQHACSTAERTEREVRKGRVTEEQRQQVCYLSRGTSYQLDFFSFNSFFQQKHCRLQ